ncbi:MAG: glutamate racemase [Ardenticatenales bacterium]|nr:glutamate racemase [Ardenticatenales bacterium]
MISPLGPIGLFDSGIGGTTVLREVRSLLPDEPLLYLADQARCPYGPRDEATLRQFSLDNTQWLLDQGAKLIVVACNTASAASLHWLREQFPAVLFVGMVPAVKPAAQATRSGVVGVLATPATMQGRLLREVLSRWTEGVTVIEQVAPGLVELIEAGKLQDEETRHLLWRYLKPMHAAGADTVVLGCTHYPYLIPLIQKLLPGVEVVDAAPAVARQVARVLQEHALLHPVGNRLLRYATTGPLPAFRTLLLRLSLPEGEVAQAQGHRALR